MVREQTAVEFGVSHHLAQVNSVRLHYVAAGTGPVVVLLHGFPEFWYSWRAQIPGLAAAGFRVIAPDMRGYNTSEKPRGVRAYRYETLIDDVAALIRHTGADRATVVGHDWGGAVAWGVPMRHPDLVERLVVLNAPHPMAMLRDLKTFAQLRRSWYILAFQVPMLPELAVRAHNYRLLRRALRQDVVNPAAFTNRDVRRYVQAMAQPGALTATINYYRALLWRTPRQMRADIRRIDAPTLLIWGMRDRYLGPDLLTGVEQWVPNLQIERIPEASHWVQTDAPQRVTELLLGFLRQS